MKTLIGTMALTLLLSQIAFASVSGSSGAPRGCAGGDPECSTIGPDPLRELQKAAKGEDCPYANSTAGTILEGDSVRYGKAHGRAVKGFSSN